MLGKSSKQGVMLDNLGSSAFSSFSEKLCYILGQISVQWLERFDIKFLNRSLVKDYL